MNLDDYYTGYRDGFIWGTFVTFVTLVICSINNNNCNVKKKD